MAAVTHTNEPGANRAPWLTLKYREMLEAWLFISPTFIGFLVFFLGPLSRSSIIR